MGKFRTIDSFFKKNEDGNSENSTLLGFNVEASTFNERPSNSPRRQGFYKKKILLDHQWWKWNLKKFV